MEINDSSAKKIRIKVETLKFEKRYYENCLTDIYSYIKTLALFDPNKTKLKKQEKEYRAKLIQTNNEIKEYVNVFESYTTFNSELFLNFLTNFLSNLKKEKYEVYKDFEIDELMEFSLSEFDRYNVFETPYLVLTTEQNCKDMRIQNDINMSAFGFREKPNNLLSACKDNQFVCLKVSDNYSLLKEMNLNLDIFNEYKELNQVADDLIDLKLCNPEISDTERLQIIVNEFKCHTKYLKIENKKESIC